jgi:repressor LexA
MPKKQMRTVSHQTAELRRARLLAVMRERGMSAAEWTRAAGVSSGTLYNFLNGRSASLSVAVIEKLAKAAALTPASLLLIEDSQIISEIQTTKVIGQVQGGAWSESLEWSAEEYFEILVPIPAPYKAVAFGLKVVGPSMNLLYPDGTFLVCVNVNEFHRPPRSGDRVIARRQRADLYETTVKEVARRGDAHFLIPRSDHPAHQKAVPLESDHTEIVAIVISSVRPEAID